MTDETRKPSNPNRASMSFSAREIDKLDAIMRILLRGGKPKLDDDSRETLTAVHERVAAAQAGIASRRLAR